MTTEVIKKENLIDMPDNSDMVAEAMKEVKCFLCRQNTQWIILKSNISCQSISKRSLMRSMEPTGIVLLAKISHHMSAMKPNTISFSMKDNLQFSCTKWAEQDDYLIEKNMFKVKGKLWMIG